MAENEVYRIEIPIIVDDQTDAPLRQAERKINRFEKSAQKTNDRLRRMFGREIKLRIEAIDKVWPVIRGVQSRLRGLTAHTWNVILQAKDKITGTIKNIINKLTSPLALLGAGAGLGAGIFFPLKLAGEMEQAGIAMEFFTESAEKGQAFLDRLQKFAARTPFEFPDVRDAAVGLMPLYKNMYGVEKAMDETMRTIQAFGDAAGLTGAGIQGMNLALLGFRQIGTMGKLSMEELRQVTENLMIPMDIILKELGLTGDALENLSKQGIDSKTAMEAIIRALEKNFAGGMDKMSKSLLGLISTIKDTARLTVWHFGAGMAEPVKRILLDIVGLTDDTGGKFEEFQRRLERVGERVGQKFEQMYERVKQFFADITNTLGFDEMTWSERVTVALDKILEAVTAWLKGPGGEAIKKTGEILGSLLAVGLEGALPNIVPIAKELGKTLGGAIVEGIYEVIKASPWAGILLGAYVGFRLAGPTGILWGAGIGAAAWGIPKGLEALGKHIPGSAYYTQERLAEYEQAEQMFKERRVVTPAGEPLFPSTELRAMPKRAIGGIYSRPHTALVAEAGPEAIIPLTSRMRSRALGLWEEAGRRLGVRPYAEGGFAGALTQNREQKIPVSFTPSLALAGPATVNLNFDLTGLVRQVVIENREDIDGAVDKITHAIANNLREVFQNMTK